MSYKSLLTVITQTGRNDLPLDTAIHLARSEDAHLDVLCLGVDRTQVDMIGFGGANPVIVTSMLDQARDEAAALAKTVSARLKPEDIRWSVDMSIAPLGAIGSIVSPLARYADLLISAPPLGLRDGSETETVVESALFEGRIPVLIVPKGVSLSLKKLHVLIAWNDGDEALSAVRAAMPVLKSAAGVSIAVIDPPVRSSERSDPGGGLAQMLSRHGIHANIAVLAKGGESIAETLLRHAREIDANLIVMGAYGHSRLRETILGGATRDMLQKASMPVLMAR